jgi:hypothetical protein
MPYSRFNGEFRIRQVTDGSDEIVLWVENDSVTSDDWDDDGCAGEAGVYTDLFTWSAAAPYIADDRLSSGTLDDSTIITAVSSVSTSTMAAGLVELLEVPAGVLFVGERTSAVIPLRANYPVAAASTTNLVRGDMLSYTGINRLLRVLSVNPDSDRTVNITVASGTATAELQSGDTTYLSSGMQVLLTQAGVHSGVVTIADVTSTTEFTWETEETAAATGATLVGETAQVDEELAWEDTIGDSNVFTVEERWIPIEAPDDSFNLTPATYIHHFDAAEYIRQDFLRSTMVVDNMYLTNGSDEVAKFDGTSLYRAGLPAWQPGLFLTQETTGATIVTDLRSIAYSAKDASTGRLTITFADSNVVPIGAEVRLSGSTQTYTIRAYTDDATDYYVFVDRALDSGVSATGTVAEIGTYRYYYRLNAVDANDNIIASAVTGYQDHVVELTGNAAILHKVRLRSSRGRNLPYSDEPGGTVLPYYYVADGFRQHTGIPPIP